MEEILKNIRARRPGEEAVEKEIEAHVRDGEAYLRAHPGTPPLYKSGIKYRMRQLGEPPEPQSIDATLQRRNGDIQDLAVWRAAELRTLGKHATVVVYPWQLGSHAIMSYQVRHPDGRLEEVASQLINLGCQRE